MTEAKREWKNLPKEIREGNILRELTLIEVQQHDPSFVHRYTQTKVQAADQSDRMRADIALSERVAQLRGEGKVSPVDQLREQAATMVDMKPDEMVKALSGYSSKIRRRG